MHATTIAVDLAKSVFQVSVANQAQRITDRKRLTKTQFQRFLMQHPPTTVVMEACATAHYWSQFAEQHGHEAKQLHAYYVRPYVRRNKTDAADADALVRASYDPQLLPIPTKQPYQQALQGIHRIRQQIIQTRVARTNLARALLAEYGISMARGTGGIVERLNRQIELAPTILQPSLYSVVAEVQTLKDQQAVLDKQLNDIAKIDPVISLLMTVPGVGVTTATALMASVPDIHMFKKARQFSAWLGVTPREHSSGNSRRLGRISKQGNEYLRTLLVHGARSAMLQAHKASAAEKPLSSTQRWILKLEETKPRNIVTIALANKSARALWSVWVKNEPYTP